MTSSIICPQVVRVAVKLYAFDEVLHHISAEYDALQASKLANCKHLCQLHQQGVGLDRSTLQPVLVMEAGEMSLPIFLIQYSGLIHDEEFCMALITQLLLALYELEMLQLIHSDIKPHNFVIRYAGDDPTAAISALQDADLALKHAQSSTASSPVAAAELRAMVQAAISAIIVTLVDFGLTKPLHPAAGSKGLESLNYTPGYGAPNLAFQGPHQPPPPSIHERPKLDTWSTGATVPEVITGK